MDLLSIVHEDLQQASDSEYTSNVYNPTRNYEQYSYYFVGVFFLKVLVVGIFSSWQRFGGEMGNMLTELKKRYNVKT